MSTSSLYSPLFPIWISKNVINFDFSCTAFNPLENFYTLYCQNGLNHLPSSAGLWWGGLNCHSMSDESCGAAYKKYLTKGWPPSFKDMGSEMAKFWKWNSYRRLVFYFNNHLRRKVVDGKIKVSVVCCIQKSKNISWEGWLIEIIKRNFDQGGWYFLSLLILQ